MCGTRFCACLFRDRRFTKSEDMKEYISRYLMNSLRGSTYIITRDILLGATEGSFLRNCDEKKGKQFVVIGGKRLRYDFV